MPVDTASGLSSGDSSGQRRARQRRRSLRDPEPSQPTSAESKQCAGGFTARELEVLRSIAGGLTNQQIAGSPFTSQRTAASRIEETWSHVQDGRRRVCQPKRPA
jgi:DNA-binding NarL/FixJ family response regulator